MGLVRELGHDCPLAYGDAPGRCSWCGAHLPPGRRRWCSDAHHRRFVHHHYWTSARAAALKRDRWACRRCGRKADVFTRLEVHHIVPVLGDRDGASCLHHQANLITLCEDDHAAVTRRQRAAGII